MSLRSTDRNRAARELFDPLPDRYDRLAELLSFGQNARWRRAMVDQVVRDRDGLVRGHGFNRRPGGDKPEERQLDGANPADRNAHLAWSGFISVPGASGTDG